MGADQSPALNVGILYPRTRQQSKRVPFDGSTGSLAALAGKHVDFSIILADAAIPLINAGKLRPLVIFSDERDPMFKDVPTSKELGLNVPTVVTVRGMQAPPKTPPTIVKVLDGACAIAIQELGYIEWAKKRNMTLRRPLNSVQYMEYVVKEAYPLVEKYEQMMKENQPSS
jgi:tripartite-type tricarboxylate transporter receptor subunit TctC